MNESKSGQFIMSFIDLSLYTRSYVKHGNSGSETPRTEVVQTVGAKCGDFSITFSKLDCHSFIHPFIYSQIFIEHLLWWN